ncbi:unnamed protein product [Alopecurus aequalis]
MAAFFQHGVARRLSGSVLQRTKAAATSPVVAEERRRLVPRRKCSTKENVREEVLHEIQQKKEEVYDVIAKAEQRFWSSKHSNKLLLAQIAVQIKPRPDDFQWGRMYFVRKALTVLETAALISLASAVATGVVRYRRRLEEDEKKMQDLYGKLV